MLTVSPVFDRLLELGFLWATSVFNAALQHRFRIVSKSKSIRFPSPDQLRFHRRRGRQDCRGRFIYLLRLATVETAARELALSRVDTNDSALAF